jgi:OOP family OmpA-OmpF porin
MITNRLRNFIMTFGMLALLVPSYGQNSQYRLSVELNGGLREYNGDLGSSMFLSKGINNLGAGASIGYYISPSFDATLFGSAGDVSYSAHLPFEEDLKYKHRHFLSQTADFLIGVRYKLNNGYILNEDALIAPYFQIGGGAFYGHSRYNYNPSQYTVWVGNYVGGAGINFNIDPRWTVKVQAIYNYTQNDIWDGEANSFNHNHSITNRKNASFDGYLYTSLGVQYNFNMFGIGGAAIGGKLKKVKDKDNDGVPNKFDECKNTPEGYLVDSLGCPLDTDNDGITDSEDKCPKEAGSIENGGCPDADGDGIIDKDDECPNQAGTAELKGCPANDQDRDGILDEDDKCPEVFGLKEFAGCPDSDGDGIQNSEDKCPNRAGTAEGEGCPDTDGDQVYDHKDVCPTVAGIVENKGCPEIKEEVKERIALAAKGIYFESGKDVIKEESFENLNKLVEILKEFKEAKVSIEGHTDSRGNDEANKTLSQKRADAVKLYLSNKGVALERMTAIGYGETVPKASNNTSAGRAENRRVEFKLSY